MLGLHLIIPLDMDDWLVWSNRLANSEIRANHIMRKTIWRLDICQQNVDVVLMYVKILLYFSAQKMSSQSAKMQ